MAKDLKNVVLDVNNLHVSFDTYAGEVKAVRGVTFTLSASPPSGSKRQRYPLL